ncbi:MAG: YesU family protein [Candidatus Marinimicrobia bacterium]|nr:YesU family protein [Candidatus Neomarinimicrobiota bacterium]
MMMKKQRMVMGAARLGVLAGLAVAADPARLGAETGLDLAAYTLEPVYAADFTDAAANRIVSESAELFAGEERQPLPEDAAWVYEGADRAWIEDGKLWLGGAAKTSRFQPEAHEAQYHSVLWNTHEFPADFLLEFTFTQTQKTGLNIVFLATRAREAFGGGDPFQTGLPRRRGRFDEYTQGALDCYHISYFATTPRGDPRGQSNLRKNHGFHLVAEGEDFISDMAGLGPHRVRVLKVGARLTLEVNGRIALAWTDTGEIGGPPHGAGWIGLRQMRHSALCAYDSFQVWAVKGPPVQAARAETDYLERVRP